MLIIASSSVGIGQEAPSCQSLMDSYSSARTINDRLPALFQHSFDVKRLKSPAVGDTTLSDRLEQAGFEVKNHTGYLECSSDGTLRVLELCANVAAKDEDPFLVERFTETAQALLNVIEESAHSTRSKIEPMIAEAGEDLKAALVRGEPVPQGISADHNITPELYARVYTAPEFPGISPAQICFQAEFFRE